MTYSQNKTKTVSGNLSFFPVFDLQYLKTLHCKNCGVLCPPNEQHTIGGISHQPLKVCLAHLIWCARS